MCEIEPQKELQIALLELINSIKKPIARKDFGIEVFFVEIQRIEKIKQLLQKPENSYQQNEDKFSKTILTGGFNSPMI